MHTHVKVLGAVNVMFGGFGVLLALALLLIFGAVAGLAGASPDPDAALAAPIIGITGMVVVAVLLALSVPGVIIGSGLLRLRPWARIGGIVFALVELFTFPVGTLIGIYGLWVLLSKETERLFQARRPPEVS